MDIKLVLAIIAAGSVILGAFSTAVIAVYRVSRLEKETEEMKANRANKSHVCTIDDRLSDIETEHAERSAWLAEMRTDIRYLREMMTELRVDIKHLQGLDRFRHAERGDKQ